VLPPVIAEGKAFPFKFWFHNSIRDGIYYRNELFYRLHTVNRPQRSRLYHYACKLARSSQVLVTASEQKCSLWISLRSPNLTAPDAIAHALPSFADLTQDEHSEPE
jgi:hypothetical protein